MLIEITREYEDAAGSPPYEAVNRYWLCLVKIANLDATGGLGERERIAARIRLLTKEAARNVLKNLGVDQILKLDPPIETILSSLQEQLKREQAQREINRLRTRRQSDPKAALLALFGILQRIRDKREHGFKTPYGARDAEILTAAASVMRCLVHALLASLKAATRPES